MSFPLRAAVLALVAARTARGLRPAARLAPEGRAAQRVVGRHPASAEGGPPASPAPSSAGRPRVTVIVPARDEAGRIAGCLAGLEGDPWVDELLVVDDRSTDGTAEVARAHGATVVPGAEPPPGRVGKPWALEQGLRAATGDVVVTLDADVRPRPGLVAALVGELLRREATTARPVLLSATGRYDCRGVGERLLHSAFVATTHLRYGPVDVRGLDPQAARATANGQVVCARRERLLRAGGFALASGRMTDDVALARALAARGWLVAGCDASAVVDVRMYESAGETWRGWSRSITAADVTARPWIALDLLVLWVAQALPWLRLATGRADRTDAGLLLVRTAVLRRQARTYRPTGPLDPFWVSPLLDVPVALGFTKAVLRPARTWRGRDYAG